MYKKNIIAVKRGGFKINTSVEGEPIELAIERWKENGDVPISSAPIIYTPRSQGVVEPYNPRADRMEIALNAGDAVSRANIAKREGGLSIVKDENTEKNGGTEPVHGSGE